MCLPNTRRIYPFVALSGPDTLSTHGSLSNHFLFLSWRHPSQVFFTYSFYDVNKKKRREIDKNYVQKLFSGSNWVIGILFIWKTGGPSCVINILYAYEVELIILTFYHKYASSFLSEKKFFLKKRKLLLSTETEATNFRLFLSFNQLLYRNKIDLSRKLYQIKTLFPLKKLNWARKIRTI